MNAPAVFDATKVDIATRTFQLLKLRSKIAEVKERHKEELKEFLEFEAKLEGQIMAFLQATKQKSAPNENGTPYLSLRVTYSVQDKQEFFRHVIGTESWWLLTGAVAKEGADKFIEDGATVDASGKKVPGPPPPGVKRNALVQLNCLSPTKPKTSVKKTATNDEIDAAQNVEGL